MEGVAYEQFLKLERDHWWFIGRRRCYLPILERFLPRKSGLRILDVGCGMGGMLPELARFGDVIGIDSDRRSIEICRERGFGNSFLGGAMQIAAASGCADLVTFYDCIEHLPDDRAALAEAHRVLAPGGTLFVSVPAYQFLYSNNDRVAHHFRRYTRGELVAKARAAGFEVVKATYVNVFLFPLIAPAVLLFKLKERLFPKPDDSRTNLSHVPPRAVNSLLAAVFGGEGKILRHVSAPFGHSLILIGRKPLPRS
jgi:SAM-dependent methyltransferase